MDLTLFSEVIRELLGRFYRTVFLLIGSLRTLILVFGRFRSRKSFQFQLCGLLQIALFQEKTQINADDPICSLITVSRTLEPAKKGFSNLPPFHIAELVWGDQITVFLNYNLGARIHN